MTGEQAHKTTVALLWLGGNVFPGPPVLDWLFRSAQAGPQVQAFGLTFPNPIGLAAGYDKDGLAWRGLARLNFGHLELGTVTPRPQPGNPEPRIFRLVEDEAVINRMGFPNCGAAEMAGRLKGRRPKGVVLGMNIGKNKTTPLDEATGDYAVLVRRFAPLCDYLAVNVSSPNTPDLRKLQSRRALEELLAVIAAERAEQVQQLGRAVPVLVKLAPDLTSDELDDALAAVESAGMDGLIIANTTLGRPPLRSRHAAETGGLSGAPIVEMNTALVGEVYRRTGGRIPIVASGGISTLQDAQAKLDAGAVLVQLYSGLIFRGPWLVRDLLQGGLRPAQG